jgi:hypothetical protein
MRLKSYLYFAAQIASGLSPDEAYTKGWCVCPYMTVLYCGVHSEKWLICFNVTRTIHSKMRVLRQLKYDK